MNRIILGILLTILNLTASAETLHWNSYRGYSPFSNSTENGIVIDNKGWKVLSDSCQVAGCTGAFSLMFRSENLHSRPDSRYAYADCNGNNCHSRYPAWGFYWNQVNGDRIRITVKNEEKPVVEGSSVVVRVTVSRKGEILAEGSFSKGMSLYDEGNIWNLVVNGGKGLLRFGNRGLANEIEFNVSGSGCSGFGFSVSPGGKTAFSDISLEYGGHTLRRLENIDDVRARVALSNDGMEGCWQLYDRETDERLLRLGGNYNLYIVRDGAGYNMLYGGGAKVRENEWQPGMLKGRLKETGFPKTYSVEWIDSDGLPMSKDITAQEVADGVIEIKFPYQTSTLRFRKLP